jgi:hypothetical protein
LYKQTGKTKPTLMIIHGGDIMAENRIQDYFDDKSEGHVDTRESNFQCDNPDEHLGCDLGIDVQG